MSYRSSTGIAIGLFLLTFIAWGVLLYVYGSEHIVGLIGAKNGYLITFLIALFGGMSSFSGSTYVAAIITFSNGGLDPFTLASCAALGVAIGDTVYFILARKGASLLHKRNDVMQKINRIKKWLDKKSPWLLWASIYFYTAFTPLPNDVLTIALGLARQPYMLVISALTLGSFTLSLLIALFGQILPF